MLVVGLGNPGPRYAESRHNVGFAAVDLLREELGLPSYRAKHQGLFTSGPAPGGGSVALLKPATFMNLSGDSVIDAMGFLRIPVTEVLVLHDELDLAFGDVRIKVGGGHAGHNGLRSILARAGSPDFVRVRVGIGRPPPGEARDVAGYVLSGFDPVERPALPGVLARAVAAARAVLTAGPAAAMNEIHARTK